MNKTMKNIHFSILDFQCPKIKKSQAAMEFLMTYGWALLVVLAAIGALAYFGVTNPSHFAPEQCMLPPGIACLDSKITQASVVVILSNSLGGDIEVGSVSAGNCSTSVLQRMDNGDKREFAMSGCNNGEAGIKFKQDLIINYTSLDSGMSKTIVGTISGKVQ